MRKRHYKKSDFDIGRSLPVAADMAEDGVKKPSRPKRLFFLVLALSFSFLLVIGIWNGVNISRASEKMFGSGNLLALAGGVDLKKDSQGRVNMLIVGYSVDSPGHEGATLTDSIMVMSLDPTEKTGYILSVPRDLYLQIPGFGYGKINEVYQDGGAELLEETIDEKLGIKIGYFFLVNYAAVRETVNALDGIDVTIASNDPRGIFDPNISPVDGGPLQLANGSHHLDGQTALNLTRARGARFGSYGFPRADLTRIDHQKKVFLAIKEKASDWSLVLNPRKNSRLFDAVANNVQTDVQPSEAVPLFRLFSAVPTQEMKTYSLHRINDKNLLRDYNGGLVPTEGLNDYETIQRAIDNIGR